MKQLLFGLIVAVSVTTLAQPKPQPERREPGGPGARQMQPPQQPNKVDLKGQPKREVRTEPARGGERPQAPKVHNPPAPQPPRAAPQPNPPPQPPKPKHSFWRWLFG